MDTVYLQNYIQNVQHKLPPAMQSLTALNNPSQTHEEESATTTLTQIPVEAWSFLLTWYGIVK